jgi:hypothetical protein
MYFLGRDEAKVLEKKLRCEIAEQPGPKLVLYYNSGARNYIDAANAITASSGKFTEATLLFLWCIRDDAWNEKAVRTAGWSRFRHWRRAAGENRRLSEAPGHQFEADEAEHLSTAVAFALELGWEALLAAKPKRQLLLLSHDDRMEIYRGFERRLLAESLIALGYWHR